MIWESTTLMTIIDLMVIGIAGCAIRRQFAANPPIKKSLKNAGQIAAALRMFLLLVFYALDLAAMHMLPFFVSDSVAMEFMVSLHLNISWILVVAGVGLIATGFKTNDRTSKGLIGRPTRTLAGRATVQSQPHQNYDTFRADLEDRLDRLTQREQEVLILVADGKSNKGVARQLGISPRTVENHRARVTEKLEVRGLSGLVRFAVYTGLLPDAL